MTVVKIIDKWRAYLTRCTSIVILEPRKLSYLIDRQSMPFNDLNRHWFNTAFRLLAIVSTWWLQAFLNNRLDRNLFTTYRLVNSVFRWIAAISVHWCHITSSRSNIISHHCSSTLSLPPSPASWFAWQNVLPDLVEMVNGMIWIDGVNRLVCYQAVKHLCRIAVPSDGLLKIHFMSRQWFGTCKCCRLRQLSSLISDFLFDDFQLCTVWLQVWVVSVIISLQKQTDNVSQQQ